MAILRNKSHRSNGDGEGDMELAFSPSEVVPRTAAIELGTFRDRMDRDFSGRRRPSLSICDTSKANDVRGCGRIHLEATAWAYVIA
jgi:hypothetical protein